MFILSQYSQFVNNKIFVRAVLSGGSRSSQMGSGACLNGIKEKWKPDGCHSNVGTVTDGLLGIIGMVVGVDSKS